MLQSVVVVVIYPRINYKDKLQQRLKKFPKITLFFLKCVRINVIEKFMPSYMCHHKYNVHFLKKRYLLMVYLNLKGGCHLYKHQEKVL